MVAGSSEVLIRVEQVSAGYDADTPLLRDVSFTVESGEILVIVGGSGSGKSTLMRHMIGLVPPLGGTIAIRGEPLEQMTEARRKDILKGVGVLFQGSALFGSLTVLENVRLPLEEHTRLPDEAVNLIAFTKLQLVGLAASAHRMPTQLSGGMQKRAALARAMVLDPPLLFLDEPSAGLDPITSADLDELIVSLSRNLGITLVVVSHELASVNAIADRVIMLSSEEQRILAEGPPNEVRMSPDSRVRRFFSRGRNHE